MPKSTPVIFKRSLIAVAVLSLSACSTMPQVPGIDLGGVGDGIVKAGKATADVSRKTWHTTAYLLGFTDTRPGGDEGPSDQELLLADGEVDQLLPLEEAPIPAVEPSPLADARISDAQIVDNNDQPVLVQQATASSVDALEPLDVRETVNATVTDATDTTVVDEAANAVAALTPVESTDDDFLAEEDLIHKVAVNENLWDIAKKTTGNANNWHVLADVNNLTQSATVFPGQELIIPSSMVKPDYDTTTASNEWAQSAAALSDTQNVTGAVEQTLAESTRLAIPSDADSAALNSAQPQELTDQQDASSQLATASQNAIPLELNEGETLWDFAKRTTGNALNWQAIADQNNFTEKQAVTVRPGQTIFVPQALLREESDDTTSAALPASTSDIQPPVADVAQTTNLEIEAATASEELTPVAVEQIAAAALPAASEVQNVVPETTDTVVAEATTVDTEQPIKIVEATYKSNDALTPVAVETESVQMVENENIPAKVVVSGTYYPKAVYNNADFSSSLLMRVSPGTTLQVSRAMGTWFEVETDKGIGFVHQRDIK